MKQTFPVFTLALIVTVMLANQSLAANYGFSSDLRQMREKTFLSSTKYLQQLTRLTKQSTDTAIRRTTRIVSISVDNDVLTLRIEIAESQSWMEIHLYNMLGKRIKEIFRGPVQSDDGIREYSISISDLPNGLYIISVQGPSIRLADKVLISR